MFYGLVRDKKDHDHEIDLKMMNDDELVVMFVVSGEFEWYDKNSPNCLISNYRKSVLVMCHPPPLNFHGPDIFAADDESARWFSKSRSGWIVKFFEDPCYGCGSPWCMYHANRTELKQMITEAAGNKRMTNKQRRYRCYRDAVSLKWGTLGHATRKRVGWCWENKCRVAFPESTGNYTGFKRQSGIESGEE